MMNTEAIYSQFKESIKSAVHTTKITSIAKTGRFNADYLFGIESSEDKLYSSVIRDMEETALREVDKLLENLCTVYGYRSDMPCEPTGYDILIKKRNTVFNQVTGSFRFRRCGYNLVWSVL